MSLFQLINISIQFVYSWYIFTTFLKKCILLIGFEDLIKQTYILIIVCCSQISHFVLIYWSLVILYCCWFVLYELFCKFEEKYVCKINIVYLNKI